MLIGELAERTGVSRRSLRYYEQQGLLVTSRTAKGWRAYDESAVNRVRNVQELLAAGLGTQDILQVAPCLDMKTQEFMACQDSPAETLAMYERRLAVVEEKAAELDRYRSRLVARIAQLRAADPDTELGEVLRRAEETDRAG
ncbi:MerR family transcriptional regulator [Streptomyces sp. 891-h]|uniref:MerR family transcriptional regulator n=1 Tax=Streptomyces sp. 891-h TaxID=2720714 RepID=UPI001FA95B28|nr:MerR family transcriptional regulator [Streptomyces sp. 891-h]UNZ19659.1 MerR family transcriptional regulator [Streptomyces sp. 891-h]